MMLNEDIKHSLPFVLSNQSLTQSNKIQLTKMDQKVSTMKTMTTCRKSYIYRQIMCVLIVSCFTTIMAAPMPTTTIASAGTTTTVLSRKTLKNPNKTKKYSEKKISIPTPQTIDSLLVEDSMETFVTSTASVPTSLVYSSLDDVIEATTMLPSTITTTTTTTPTTTSTFSTTIELGNNEKSPVTMIAIETMISTTPLKVESINSYDDIRNNEMVSRRLQTNDNLNEGLLKTEVPMNIHHPVSSNDNLSAPIHAQIVINAKDDNKNKSINLNGQKDDDKYDDITKSTTTTTAAAYIKHHTDDDLKLMDNERDVEINLDTSTSIPEKKMPKSNKKKAQNTMETKKQKLKLKTVEPTTMSSIFSTSIKTAPTTIKSTTLTTTKSFEMENEETTTETVIKEKLSMQLNSMVSTTSEVIPETTTTTTTINESHDKIIILNSNTSGLIVVDIMENFGKTNSSSNTTEGEAFEIKMDLIEDTTDETNNDSNINQMMNGMQKSVMKDDIFMTATTLSSIITGNDENVNGRIESTTKNDDIILINESTGAPIIDIPTKIKWNAVKNVNDDGNIKIMFDNINLPSQHVNVSIENGELMIDNIDISILNKAEEEYQRLKNLSDFKDDKSSKSDSLEIILIEDLESLDSTTIESSTTKVLTIGSGGNDEQISHHNSFPTTIQFELPNKVKHNNKMEMDGSSAEDEIKIKTTNKDSDTIFYISNTEVKVIESMPTALPEKSHYYPAIYEEDVIVDFPDKNHSTMNLTPDKYEEDIVLSPLTSDFDPKDINYIGEAFLDVEESQNGQGSFESHHIIPLTSDVVIQPVSLQDSPPVGVPIIGEVPPQIELEEMVFNDDYDSNSNSKQTSNFRFEEYYPNFLGNRLVKNQLTADVPKELISDPRNGTFIVNRTHISINTMINGTNVTTLSSPFSNSTAYLLENDDNDNNGGKVACMNNFISQYYTILYSIIYLDGVKLYRKIYLI